MLQLVASRLMLRMKIFSVLLKTKVCPVLLLHMDIPPNTQPSGYVVPERLTEDPLVVTVTDTVSEFDATTPAGLQIAR
jgi:hypothetical protein